MTRSRLRSNRFLPPGEKSLPSGSRLPTEGSSRSSSRPPGAPWGPAELFAEGQWQTIRVGLERQGWSATQIERVHDHLRQGWPLAMAKQNVATLTRHCPLRSRYGET
ncbi:MAG: hypothetical protein VKO39_13745 [Cyanobacteriota bacterium]|nr:hypothetical protein [Cyanobacteriota bacterium]